MSGAAGGLQLPDSIASVQDVRSLAREVHAYASWAAHEKVKQQRAGGAPAGTQPELSPAGVELLGASAGKQGLTGAKIDSLLEALAELEANAPRVGITLAAPAPGQLRRELVAWCRANLDEHALVAFDFNRTILGGMVVRYGSHVYDWSFRRQILATRQLFPALLRQAAGLRTKAGAGAAVTVASPAAGRATGGAADV